MGVSPTVGVVVGVRALVGVPVGGRGVKLAVHSRGRVGNTIGSVGVPRGTSGSGVSPPKPRKGGLSGLKGPCGLANTAPVHTQVNAVSTSITTVSAFQRQPEAFIGLHL